MIIGILSAAALVYATYLFWGVFRMLLTEGGRAEFKETVMELGPWGWLLLLGVNVAQVFLFFFPGEPVELLTGMCYGPLWGTLLIYLGVFVSCGIIFYLVRKVGKKAVCALLGEEKVQRIENSKYVKSGTAERLVLLLFVIPGTPKDFLVYVGAMMPVKASRFIILSTLFRFPGIVSSTVVGGSFAAGNTLLAFILYGVTLIVSLLLLRHYSKKEDVREVLELSKNKRTDGKQEEL